MGAWFDPASLGSAYCWIGSSYRNGWDPDGLKRKRQRDIDHEPQGDAALQALRKVLQKAIAEVDAMEGVEDPKDGAHRSELSAGDVEWQAAQFRDNADDSTRNKHEGNTYDKENGQYLAQINLWKTAQRRKWVRTMLHEGKHVALFRKGVCSPHHETDEDKEKFEESVSELVIWLENSETLALFDEWMAYYSGESRPYGQLQKAAEGTLTGQKPPPRK